MVQGVVPFSPFSYQGVDMGVMKVPAQGQGFSLFFFPFYSNALTMSRTGQNNQLTSFLPLFFHAFHTKWNKTLTPPPFLFLLSCPTVDGALVSLFPLFHLGNEAKIKATSILSPSPPFFFRAASSTS